MTTERRATGNYKAWGLVHIRSPAIQWLVWLAHGHCSLFVFRCRIVERSPVAVNLTYFDLIATLKTCVQPCTAKSRSRGQRLLEHTRYQGLESRWKVGWRCFSLVVWRGWVSPKEIILRFKLGGGIGVNSVMPSVQSHCCPSWKRDFEI